MYSFSSEDAYFGNKKLMFLEYLLCDGDGALRVLSYLIFEADKNYDSSLKEEAVTRGLKPLFNITQLGRRKVGSIPGPTEWEANILSISLYVSGKLFPSDKINLRRFPRGSKCVCMLEG